MIAMGKETGGCFVGGYVCDAVLLAGICGDVVCASDSDGTKRVRIPNNVLHSVVLEVSHTDLL